MSRMKGREAKIHKKEKAQDRKMSQGWRRSGAPHDVQVLSSHAWLSGISFDPRHSQAHANSNPSKDMEHSSGCLWKVEGEWVCGITYHGRGNPSSCRTYDWHTDTEKLRSR